MAQVKNESDDRNQVYEQLNLFGEVFDRIRSGYVEDVESSDLISAAIRGMLTSLDPHSGYMPPDNFEDMQVDTKGAFGGLGIEVTQEDGFVKVVSPMDGTPASEDFGDMLVSECFIPQIVYSTTFGYRTDVDQWGGNEPDDICDVFDLNAFPGKRSLEKRPINNMEWALLCDGVAKVDIYKVLETPEGQAQALAKLDTIKDHVIFGLQVQNLLKWYQAVKL